MSIGTVIADVDTVASVETKDHILSVECQIGGIYYDAVFLATPMVPILCIRAEAILALRTYFQQHSLINACFDRNHLPELYSFN